MKKSLDVNSNLLSANFKGRIIKKNTALHLVETVTGIIHYYIENSFNTIRLYDRNGIKINIEYYKSNGYLEKIELSTLFIDSVILSIEESKLILEEFLKNTSVLKIFYQCYENNPIQRGSSAFNFQNNEINEIEMPDSNLVNPILDLVPYKVEPDYIDLNQYKIDIAENKIIDVLDKETNLKVMFESQLISNEIESKFSSLVSQSTMRVYTCLYSQNIVNIVHIHLNDTSESIAVDSFFLEKQDSISEFKKFDIDITGKKLNYKFLFRDFKVNYKLNS